MKYAVLQTGGKQYKVSVGSEIEVDKLDAEVNSSLTLEKVLLVADENNFQIGQPLVAGVKITARVMEQKKGKKIRVAKFKAKARYRKVTGHRQMLTKLQIIGISESSSKKSESKPTKAKLESTQQI